MSRWSTAARVAVAASVLFVAACQDVREPVAPPDAQTARVPHPPQDLRAWFARSAPEVLALPQTVFAAPDESAGVLVFGIEHPRVAAGVQGVLARQGVPPSAYRIEVTQPIHFMSSTLRTEHRPTKGGLQIHWDGFVCTLGFNVDHSGGRSFITNSHCTSEQGVTGNTQYNQPSRSASPDPIGFEADDPAYFTGPPCSSGRRCRYSDAARARYESGTESSRGEIAKTTGVNNGRIDVDGSFWITEQNTTSTSFSGAIHKVGRTTGWTQGNVSNTCATVNVSGSDIQLLCQTLVQRRGRQIVGGGDSGSPVFQIVDGDNVRLVGILWGGSFNGDTFVFSPLKGIQDELGTLAATGEPPPGEDPPPDKGDDNGNGNDCPPGHQRQGRC